MRARQIHARGSLVYYEEIGFLGGESSPTTTIVRKEKTVNYIDLPVNLLKIAVERIGDKIKISVAARSL